MSKINKIKLSGTTYDIQDLSATSVVNVTQAEYDALVTGGTVDPTTLYNITDAQAGDLSQYWTSAQTNSAITQAVSGKADTSYVDQSVSGKQDTLVSGTNIKTINNESILGSGNIDIQGGGGGKAVSGGTNISITTGETADTINCTLPITAGTGTNSLILGYKHPSDSYWDSKASGEGAIASGTKCTASGPLCAAIGYNNTASGGTAASNFAQGYMTTASGNRCHSEGLGTSSTADASHSEGHNTVASGNYSHSEGEEVKATNVAEHSQGRYNVSTSASTAWGDSGNTLFSVGNGTADNARHNAFEIRQNGDIYLTKDGQDVKLQDQLGGGGGSSYTAGDGIDITNNVISVTGKADTSAVTAIQDSLSGYVTTDTKQDITVQKNFIGDKGIKFSQRASSNKPGFVIYAVNTANTTTEAATFEFRPNTFTETISGTTIKHPLLYFGHYRTYDIANKGIPQTVVGFRQYDQPNAAAYHYLMPLPEKAKTPFSLTTSFKDYYAPMGFKNGSTMITADNTGVVDLSSELGGLKLVKLSQNEYDALSPNYDSNTLYIVTDS